MGNDTVIKASVAVSKKEHEGTAYKMLMDMLLRKAYVNKMIPSFVSAKMSGNMLLGELEGIVGDPRINFDSYIEAEMINMWKERFGEWEQNKDTPQA